MHARSVYAIVNNKNGKLYIGSSISTYHRMLNHFCSLKRNKHGNSHLQRAWNKYGSANFEFKILEVVPESTNIIEREQHYIDLHTLDNLYNIQPKAGSNNAGMRFTDEHKKGISIANKGRKPSSKCLMRHFEVMYKKLESSTVDSIIQMYLSDGTLPGIAKKHKLSMKKVRRTIEEQGFTYKKNLGIR